MLTAHQPNYLPYPGFFQKIAAADSFLLVDTTQFVKRGPFGWIHRNRIRTRSGPAWLSLPVLSKGRFDQSIVNTELNPRVKWGHKHFRTLEVNYGRAPYWSRYSPGLREIYEASWSHLSPLNTALIRWFLHQLQLDPTFQLASELEATGKSTDYIVAFCQELGERQFLSGRHGLDYLQQDQFLDAGIELFIQNYEAPRYEVVAKRGESSDELSNLSMLDMLFWCGDQAVEWVHQVPEAVMA